MMDYMRPPPAVPSSDASRMTWLDDEIFAFVNNVNSSESEDDTSVVVPPPALGAPPIGSDIVRPSCVPFVVPQSVDKDSQAVEIMLQGLNLDSDYFDLFVMEDFDDMSVLQGLAQGSASEFRNMMKEIGVKKAGQREKILQAVLAGC
jgi:hypothetical protein